MFMDCKTLSFQNLAVLSRLRKCKHENTSLQNERTGLIVCFECGSTTRFTDAFSEAETWVAPWIWRENGSTKN